MSLDIIKTPSLLLSSDNKEVVRNFEDNYVITEFKKYRALKVPDSDIVKFFHKAQVTGANPILDEIFLIPRNVKVKENGRDTYVTVGTIVFNYNFIRKKAQESKEYQGMTIETKVDKYFDPISGKEKDMLRSTATCKRNGSDFTFTAWWDEFVQTTQYGPNAQWKGKPHMMLSKCAEAGALRMAFPEWLAGSYAQEEMGAIEKDDDFIEAQFETQKESEKKEVIQERIEEKESIKEDKEEIEKVVTEIKGMMQVIMFGMTDVQEKGKLMFELLGVRSFSDINNKPLNELNSRLKSLVAYNEELKQKCKSQEDKPSFVLDNN